MAHLATLVYRVRRVWLPQVNVGTVSWLMHRLTGLALAVYLLPHFFTINHAREGAEAFDSALATYTGPFFAAAEYVLVATVVFHLLNGLRIIAVDFFDLSHRQRFLFALVLIGCAAVIAAASVVFVPRILAPVAG